MALDATIGGLTSNSYATVAEAEAYFSDRAFATAWDNSEVQDQLLVTATSLLEWYVKWKGTKVLSTQALHWPATGAERANGVAIIEDDVPYEVKVAVFELVLASAAADRTSEDPLAGIESLKVASLAIKSAEIGSSKGKKVIPEKIWKILSDFCYKSGGGTVWLMRG